MARIVYGSLVSAITGRVGGLVFRGGRSGPVVCQSPTRTASASSLQLHAKSILSQCSRAWVSLLEREKKSWATYATPSPPPGEVFVPSRAAGKSAFMRWYSCFLWCSVTPTHRWPVSPPFLFNQAATFAMTPGFGAAPAIMVDNDTDDLQASLWIARRTSSAVLPSRPVWQLVTSPSLGDVQSWDVNPLWYPGGSGLLVAPFLAARVAQWSATDEYIYRLRVTVGSQSVIRVDTGLWFSGTFTP